ALTDAVSPPDVSLTLVRLNAAVGPDPSQPRAMEAVPLIDPLNVSLQLTAPAPAVTVPGRAPLSAGIANRFAMAVATPPRDGPANAARKFPCSIARRAAAFA